MVQVACLGLSSPRRNPVLAYFPRCGGHAIDAGSYRKNVQLHRLGVEGWGRIRQWQLCPGFVPVSSRRAMLVVGAKKKPDGGWEPKEVIFDENDLMQLEFMRLLGESREMSIARVVAKKLNPHATNLEIQKMVKQKGAKAFLKMISKNWEQQASAASVTPVERKPEASLEAKKKDVDGMIPLSPKPSSENASSETLRRPGYTSSVAANSDWMEKADISQEKFRRLLDGQGDFDIRKKNGNDIVQLAPRPGSAKQPITKESELLRRPISNSATPTSANDLSVERLRELIGESSKFIGSKSPAGNSTLSQKPAPQLQVRPSRRGEGNAVPTLTSATPTKMNLAVPSLSMRPEIRSPSTPKETEAATPPNVSTKRAANEEEPTLTLHKPVAFKEQVQTAEQLVDAMAEEMQDREAKPPNVSTDKAANVKEPTLTLHKPVTFKEQVQAAEVVDAMAEEMQDREANTTNISTEKAANVKEPTRTLHKPVTFKEQVQTAEVVDAMAEEMQDREANTSNMSTEKAANLKGPTLTLHKSVTFKEHVQTAEVVDAMAEQMQDRETKPPNVSTEKAANVKEPSLTLHKPVAFKAQVLAEQVVHAIAEDKDLADDLTLRKPSASVSVRSVEKSPDPVTAPVSFQDNVNVTEEEQQVIRAPLRKQDTVVDDNMACLHGLVLENGTAGVSEHNPDIAEESSMPLVSNSDQARLTSEVVPPREDKLDVDVMQAVGSTEILRRPMRTVTSQTVTDRPQPEPMAQFFPQKTVDPEEIERDWARAEAALDTKTVQVVLFVGSNAGGMIARFGCLNGFLPGKDLLESRGLKTFRSWARDRGQDVNHTSIWDSSDNPESTFASSSLNSQGLKEETESHVIHPTCESDLHEVYRRSRLSFLSSFVGEKAKVTVTYADKTRKKLIFSERKAATEDPDVAQRRADLMAKLKIGDVVTGKVRNISLFGVFVELAEGFSGLIHFSELSWTTLSDPASLVHVGEELKAKVHKLDHHQQRIYLSLKRMSPDPLLETVGSMLARSEDADDCLNESEALSSPELEALLKRLRGRKDIEEVVKGRCVHGAAVVPNFQVYLSSTLPEGYKLVARFGNEVQEVLVQTSVDREAMKGIIIEATDSG